MFHPVAVLFFSKSVFCRGLRQFLIQSDLSVENGQPKSGFLTESKKPFSTQIFSTEKSDWRVQSKKSNFSSGSSSRKTQSKKFDP